jgi:hypothetical protein
MRVAWIRLAGLVLAPLVALGHETITTKLTWSKEVSRVVLRRCGGCHRPEGRAFSLQTYAEARPWAKAIQEEVLNRRMPPWRAIQGFGEMRHDMGLSGEEIHLIADWVEGGAPEGDSNLLPVGIRGATPPAALEGVRRAFRGFMRLSEAVTILGVELGAMAEGQGFKLVAEMGDGERLALLWIEGYSSKAISGYEFAAPVRLRAGTTLRAYPSGGVRLNLVTGSGRRR